MASSMGEQIVRFVAVRCGIARQRLLRLEEQTRVSGQSKDAELSARAALGRVRALELVLASCVAETGVVHLPQLPEEPAVLAPRSTPDPEAIRGRWTAPSG
jgi:hypothetical protein